MAQKLSLKLLKSIVAEGKIGYEGIVERLDKDQTSYNELMLKGMLQESLDKGNFQLVDGTYQPKPRASTGGLPPTHMFYLDKPLKPAEAKLVSKPYDEERVKSDPLVGTTPLSAIKAAKAHFYNTVYWPALAIFRQMEEEHSPSRASSDAEAASDTADAA
jgi:hypothetical protein